MGVFDSLLALLRVYHLANVFCHKVTLGKIKNVFWFNVNSARISEHLTNFDKKWAKTSNRVEFGIAIGMNNLKRNPSA
jgi:hypothetical protein